MSVVNDAIDAELKERHRKMWSLGDYPAVADDVIPDLGAELVEACRIRPGDTVLDIACGSGNAAVPAARLGAAVTGCDLTPALLEAGERRAAEQGVDISWRQADAESLPFEDGEFDVVVSCVGIMFAPHHQASADELMRVCRPGGGIGLVNWTPEGFVGQMFAVMKPYSPAPPPGADPPPRWGDEEHVLSLLGNRVTDVAASRRAVTVDRFRTPAEFRDYFKANYGPTIVTYRHIAEDADRVAELDAALADLGDGALENGTMSWEYLLVIADRSDSANQ